MPRRHRNLNHFITGDGGVTASKITAASIAASNGTKTNKRTGTEQEFKYDRMFETRTNINYKGLMELGRAMTQGSSPEDNPDLPAGYVYLAQFIAHDLSFAQLNGTSKERIEVSNLYGTRSPSLDLDSLYGKGLSDKQLYKASDDVHLRLGYTTPTRFGSANIEFENDLPRDSYDTINPRKAIIADYRNDDNLVVAQTHVAFAKFHNAVVDTLATKLSGSALFEEAREQVVKHYQWIVLKDFLPRVIDATVLDAAIQGLKFFREKENELRMPIEFSFAAFRFGHSQIGSTYEWNRIFRSPKQGDKDAATLYQLFELTGLNGKMGIGGSLTLPSNWIIDWTRFYDIPGNVRAINRAKKIGSRLVRELGNMPLPTPNALQGHGSNRPGFLPEDLQMPRSLAVFDLIRGANLGLPTGQDVADEIGAPWKLTPDDIGQGPHAGILKDHGFDRRTPLWYYILREAELFDGKRLGPVGSCIVAETIVGIIRASRISILREKNWRPELGRKDGEFTMADLLLFVNQQNQYKPPVTPIVEPIGGLEILLDTERRVTPPKPSIIDIVSKPLSYKSELNPLGGDAY